MNEGIHVLRPMDGGWRDSRRPGIRQQPMLSPESGAAQNLVLVEYEEGAAVEMHETHVPETIFVISGQLVLDLPGGPVGLGPQEAVYFEPGTSHGMHVEAGPCRCLLVFSPH